MDKTIAFLELKYGHIYGSSQWQKVVNEASVLIHNPQTDRIRIYTKIFRTELQLVLSHGVTNDLGITVGRDFEVVDLMNGRKRSYDEEFILRKSLKARKMREAGKIKAQLKQFLIGVMKYHQIDALITYGGSRDISICQHCGVRFTRIPKMEDTQRLLQKYTKHLFSLNMAAKIIGFEYQGARISSNNCEYKLHNRTAYQMKPNTATHDVARAFLVHQEFTNYQQNMIIKAALQMQKVQDATKAMAKDEELPNEEVDETEETFVAPNEEDITLPVIETDKTASVE